MYHTPRILLTVMLACQLCACSPSQDQTPKIAEDQREALDQAKTLESAVQRSAEEQARKTEAQTE